MSEEFQIGTPPRSTGLFNPFSSSVPSPFREEAQTATAQPSEVNAEHREPQAESRAASAPTQQDVTQAMLLQMMGLMQEQNRQNSALLELVTRRLEALETSRAPYDGRVPPPPPGLPQGSVQPTGPATGYPVSSTIPFPSDGKMPFGVNLPVADHKSWHTRLQELLGYRVWLEAFLSTCL